MNFLSSLGNNKNGDCMTIKNYNEKLFHFIEQATCCFTGVQEIRRQLLEEGFIELLENEEWALDKNKKYFVIRNDASIIAFTLGNMASFHITCTHVDTPGFMIKPKNEIYEKNYLKINVFPYGGLLNYAWLDEALSIAGRVIVKRENHFFKEIIDLKEPLLCIPSVAIHQNSQANQNLALNDQIDMIPILSLTNKKEVLKSMLSQFLKLKANEELFDYDLFLYATAKPEFLGLKKEMILSPRLDDLACVFPALKSFIDNKNKNNNTIFCAFNSEEIGSLTKEGADSSFLMDILKRISAFLEKDLSIMISNSTILSADNTHATHPNHPGNSDINNEALLNKGIVVSKDASSTTDSITSSLFKGICDRKNVPYQDFVTKNDMTSGSTLSGISLRHVSIDSIDIGLGQLAMHGAKEIIGKEDSYFLYLAFKSFYETQIIKQQNHLTLK